MKAYGKPRYGYFYHYDLQDGLEFAVKSKFAKMHNRHAARRIFKKKERSFVKNEIFNEIKTINL